MPIISGGRSKGRLSLAFALASLAFVSSAAAQSVLTYHGRTDRHGNYTMPSLSWEAARSLRLDTGFAPRFEGHLYAQPLYWRPPGAETGLLLVASESNIVTAIDAATGNTVWTRTLGRPVPFSAFACGNIHGWVVGVPLADPQRVSAWRSRGRGAGIWAPGGIASDGQALYVSTGNTLGARDWADGEAVFRLHPDLRHSERNSDFFAATDWRALDSRDADLGGTNPLPLDLPGGQPVVLALGKDEKAYLLDRHNLGGFGGSLVIERVATYPIRTAPAAYPAANAMFV